MKREIFEGKATADVHAETESRKKGSELFVVKCGSSGSYGINYQIITSSKELRPGEKIVSHYSKGNKLV